MATFRQKIQLPGRRALLLASLLAVWQVANTAGFLWEWAGHVRGRD